MELTHHGSCNGTDARWLGLVRPGLAVASLGKGNEYGHPHPGTIALLDRRGVPLLRTDVDGTIELVSDGATWRVVSPRGAPRRAEVAAGGGRLIDVNTATMAELEALPGVGPANARKIIDGRPYRSVDDLLQVKGIGEKKLTKMRPFLTAG